MGRCRGGKRGSWLEQSWKSKEGREERMGNEERVREDESEIWKVLHEGFSFLICFMSSGCSLPDSLPPSLPLSFHLSDRQLLGDSLCCCSLRPESPDSTRAPQFLHLHPNMLLYFTPPPRPLSLVWKNLQFFTIDSNRKFKKVFCVGYMRTSVTSACNQSLFGLLHSLLAICLRLSCHRLVLFETSEELEWTSVDHLLDVGHSLLSTSSIIHVMQFVSLHVIVWLIDKTELDAV